MRIDSCGRAHHHNQEFGGHLGQASEKQQICIEGVTIIGFRHSGADRHYASDAHLSFCAAGIDAVSDCSYFICSTKKEQSPKKHLENTA